MITDFNIRDHNTTRIYSSRGKTAKNKLKTFIILFS